MRTRLFVSSCVVVIAVAAAIAQDAKTALGDAARAMGAANLTSIQYSGSGFNFALGQSPNPDAPWPRFIVKNATIAINYDAPAMRLELLRTQGENPPRGGGGQPLLGEQRQVQLVSGGHAWNLAGDTPTAAPAAASERQLQIWLTPHGFVKAAMANNATARTQTIAGRKVTVVSFNALGKFTVNGFINDQHLVERTETWIDHPVLGDMPIETTYADYKDFAGVKFPTTIVQKQGGFPTLDLTVGSVTPNAAADIQVPPQVQQAAPAPVRVEAQRAADGVWYLAGGSHNSVAVEFNDHIVVVEAPLNEERSLAVIAEVKKAIPNKPIKYLVNTHHHFDHSGGIRTYAAEGATIITHQVHRPFYEKAFAAARTLNPDRLAQSKKKAAFETMTDKRILTDGTRTLELHLIRGNPHNDALVMAYLPKEKILIEADAYNPAPPNAPPPPTPNPFSVNLYENIQRLKLDVGPIAPIHGRLLTLADLLKAIGRASGTQ